MINNRLVTVIALCYNHAPYLVEALDSVKGQSYKNIELIIVDDGSQDESQQLIRKWLADNIEATIIFHEVSLGNCKSFNEALRLAKGDYVIDFATDDVMFPDMVESQVKALEDLPAVYGVVFSDSLFINSESAELGGHYKRNQSGQLISKVPSENVYKDVVRSYFISPPTVIFRRDVLDSLGGYDELLAYEDFDIWVRASRNFYFYFLDKKVIKKRVLKKSLSAECNKRRNKISYSTYRVCEKIRWLNQSPDEDKVLSIRIKYEMKAAYFISNFELVKKYFQMLKDIDYHGAKDRLYFILSMLRVDVYYFYRCYLKLKR